jgi:hypothetical protein
MKLDQDVLRMSALYQLPTLDRLGVTVDSNLQANTIAKEWFLRFSEEMQSGDPHAVASLFLTESFWRDILALTWDMRTIHGQSDIKALLKSRLPEMQFSDLQMAENDQFRSPTLTKLFPDLVLLQICFDFNTKVGKGTGTCRLVPTANDGWKAYTMYTCLDSLTGFLPKVRYMYIMFKIPCFRLARQR